MSVAAVMPIHQYSWHFQEQRWMLAQMTNTYPPPPQPDGHQYNALYSNAAGDQQYADPVHQHQLQYNNHLNQSIYPKTDNPVPDPSHSGQHMQRLAQELQHHAAIGEQQQQQQQQRQQLQQAPHHIAPQTSSATQPILPALAQTLPQAETPDQAQKANRLRKACDSCSVRKVKCDEQTPCRACAALEIPCTFARPSRRRGPPNRHAEAIKRRQLEDGSPLQISRFEDAQSPPSPTHAARAPTISSSQPPSAHSAETLGLPIETLELLIDDFFANIHPLCPFPHEPSFREQWRSREDRRSSRFLALLASMIAGLVASFPRKPRLRIKALRRKDLFPNHFSLIERCQEVCAAARGPGYLDKNLDVYDAATSYFLGLSYVYTYRWTQGRLYFGESLTMLRALGLHKAQEQRIHEPVSDSDVGQKGLDDDTSDSPIFNKINLEVSRRIFWTIFISSKSLWQLNARFGELYIQPPTRTEPYPPLPIEADDHLIYADHVEPQPPGVLPLLAGFNANVRVHRSYEALATIEVVWGVDSLVDWERQQRVLHESLQTCKHSLGNLPAEFWINDSRGLRKTSDPSNGFYPPMIPYSHRAQQAMMSPTQSSQTYRDANERRLSQYEIQKANIHVSSLATRSYIVEKYWTLRDSFEERSGNGGPDSRSNSPSVGVTAAKIDQLFPPQLPARYFDQIEMEMRQERDTIVADLFAVLANIAQVNMEPNAHSLTMKIRAIAMTLVAQENERRHPLPEHAKAYLDAFMDIMARLERISPANSTGNEPADEETELRAWADLRQYQLDFKRKGGLLGVS